MPIPDFDEDNLLLRNAGDQFVDRHQQQIDNDAPMPRLSRIYFSNAMRPFNRRTCAYLESGQWKGYVKPQQAIADKLGMERTCFSRARRHGTLPDYALVALMFDPNQPRDWLSSCALVPEMNRAGFIAVGELRL